MTRRLWSLLAALLLGSAAGVVATSGVASAAACPAGTGVTVVVGSSVSCDADGGTPASNNFRDAGHTLTMVDRQPGFVCRVDGAPSSAGCVDTPPADAYWGLFWSDGTSGTWVYATRGVGTLKVPAGGWVAFTFQAGDARTYPGVVPVTAAATQPTAPPASSPTAATPTKKPVGKPTAAPTRRPTSSTGGSGGSGGSTGSTTGGGTPSTSTPTPQTPKTPTPGDPSASAGPTTSAEQEPSPDVTEGVVDELAPTAAADDGGSGRLGWVAGGLAFVLLAGIAVVLRRRRAAGGPS